MFFFDYRCLKMSWKAWFRTRWPKATPLQVSWLWDRLLTWWWPAPWEGLAPWLHPSVRCSVCQCLCVSMSPSVSLWAWLSFGVYTRSVCIMQAEYLHCKRINSQILVTLNNPETAEKAKKTKHVVDSILHCQRSITLPSWPVLLMNYSRLQCQLC